MSTESTIQVLLAVRRPLIRRGLQWLVPRALPEARLLNAESGRELQQRLLQKPAIVLAEPELLEELGRPHEALSDTRLLLVSDREHVGIDALPGLSSACGHVGDASGEEALIDVLRRIAACHHRSVRCCHDVPCALKASRLPRELNLSGREQEVLILLGRGMQPREIADQLQISVKTVESYRSQLKEKLGLRDSRGLLEFALLWRRGLAH